MNTDTDKIFIEWKKQIAFSIKDIAEMLDIPISTITKLCREGSIKTFKIGRHYRVAKTDLIDYIEQKKDESIIL